MIGYSAKYNAGKAKQTFDMHIRIDFNRTHAGQKDWAQILTGRHLLNS